jgi:hypothetical protein
MKLTDKDRRKFQRMVDKAKRNAYNSGQPWSDDEVGALVNAIEADHSTFDTAMSLGRSYYSIQTARAHVGFALRHAAVLYQESNITPMRKRA